MRAKFQSDEVRQFVNNMVISFVAIVLSLAVSAIIMLIAGYQPGAALSALLDGAFGSRNAIANTLSKSVPLIFVGLACAFANKGGMFNIGAEGQLYMGGFAAVLTGLALQDLPAPIILATSVVVGMLAGGMIGGMTGLLKAKLQIHEVIVAIMLNYIIRFFVGFWVNGPFKDPNSQTAQTLPVGEENMFTKLITRTQLTTALFLALILVLLLAVFFGRTRMGFNIRAVGENPKAAQASGIAMSRTIMMTMAISGAIAGLTGVTEIFGKTGRFIDGFSPGFGFTGIAVAVLGRNNPIGVVFSAILFGIIDAGSLKMSYVAGISSSMINVMNGLVILFVATPELIRKMAFWKGGTNHA
ncbi:MAG: ABC transporter permease [Eubacteriales bacterium]|nr:ABC transporter permease [Eubacteriales bacterium]